MGEFLVNTLTWWQWAILAAIPPLIVLLYFLKLKRRPLEVPSTFLWHRTIEDLHVNAIWQRLRQNLLLFLQLLFIGLLALALIRPGWQALQVKGKHVIFMIDCSASMSANDVGSSRLEEAKRQAIALVDQMESDSEAMVISFSDRAKVEQTFTNNKNLLRGKLKLIAQTTHTTNLDEALRAASGLANPSRTGNASEGDAVDAKGIQANVYILSDGGLRTIPQTQLGNLNPVYLPIGKPDAKNVAITAFSTQRNPDKPGRLQAFARVENFSPGEVTTNASLLLNDKLLDAQSVKLAARDEKPGVAGVQFDLEDTDGVLKIEIDAKDNLSEDNAAYSVLNSARPARVLVVSPGDAPYQRRVLETEAVGKVAQVTFVEPPHLETKQYQDDAASGVFDLIIYDRCAPKSPPQSNTLFIGRAPPFDGWPAAKPQGSPAIVDIDRVHPLTQLMDMSNVLIVESNVVDPPKSGLSLIEADIGPVYSVGPRQSFEDAALGFEIESSGDKVTTDWVKKRSFPLFYMNAIKYLGGVSSENTLSSVQPGSTYHIRTVLPVNQVTVTTPQKQTLVVPRETASAIAFSQTDELGVYLLSEGSGTKAAQQFAVNLFDDRESDLLPAEKIPIGVEQIQATSASGSAAARKELWKWILLLGLAIVLLEWYVYNQRVYL